MSIVASETEETDAVDDDAMNENATESIDESCGADAQFEVAKIQAETAKLQAEAAKIQAEAEAMAAEEKAKLEAELKKAEAARLQAEAEARAAELEAIQRAQRSAELNRAFKKFAKGFFVLLILAGFSCAGWYFYQLYMEKQSQQELAAAALAKQKQKEANIDALGKEALEKSKNSPVIRLKKDRFSVKRDMKFTNEAEYVQAAVKVVEQFYLTRGAKGLFVDNVRNSAALKHGVLAGYEFPVSVEVKLVYLQGLKKPIIIVVCDEIVSYGYPRKVAFALSGLTKPEIRGIGDMSGSAEFSLEKAEWEK